MALSINADQTNHDDIESVADVPDVKNDVHVHKNDNTALLFKLLLYISFLFFICVL